MSDYVEFWHCGDCVREQKSGCGKEWEGKVCGREHLIEKEAITGQYYVFMPDLPYEPIPIPNSHHVYPNDGALMIFDSDDNAIQIYAPGHWAQVMSKSQFEEWERINEVDRAKGRKLVERMLR